MNPRHTFDSFVVGRENRPLVSIAQSIIRDPDTRHNPFLIWGGVGLGKTHLMNAIEAAMRRRHPKRRILHTTAGKFVDECSRAERNNRLAAFRSRYLRLDCLLLDDVQFLPGKKPEKEVLHIIDGLLCAQKQIVLSSGLPIKSLASTSPALFSRLRVGTFSQVAEPSLKTRLAILQRNCRRYRFALRPGLTRFVAKSIKNDVCLMEGAQTCLGARQALTGRRLSVTEGRRLLMNLSHA